MITAIRNEVRHQQSVLGSYWPRSTRHESPPDISTRDGDLITRVLRSGRPWEGWLEDYFERFCAFDSIAVDVGANIGVHTRNLAVLSRHVIALEPQRDVYQLLRENTMNLTNVTPINAAASAHPGVLGMKHRVGNCGGSHVTKDHPDELVTATRLDDLDIPGTVGLIKIDVEGHEREVILGAVRLIQQDEPTILMEDRSRARELLKDLGYRIRRISLFDFLCTPGHAPRTLTASQSGATHA